MNRSELQALIENGEDSGVEFKRDDIGNHDVAKELVAMLNLDGGTLLLGIEDDGSITGSVRPNLEEWITELCRVKIDPPVIPFLSWVRNAEPDRDVLAVRVTIGPDKPYARLHNNRKTYFVRAGSTSQEASRDELERMFQASGRLHYGLKPVPGADFETFDHRRLRDYIVRILGEPTLPEDWETLLRNIGLMTVSANQHVATIDGMLLFGRAPYRFVPQSGIRALCFPSTEPDYATRADEDLRGPMVPLGTVDGTIDETGLVEQAWDFVRRNTTPTARLENGRRIDRWEYPESVVREAVVNALVHRDYSIAGTDITLAIFSDRLEIVSPGRLPNTVTTEGMKAGVRYARNQTLVNIMRDYGYADARGMGIRTKIIPGMRAHNGTEPDLVEEESRFIVRLWKEPKRK
ncbi:MAG: putative DNA binding domain-containing protein [Truepera sp.]|nr:putative DNA binding domain-containing protein [Truepera sp.]